MSTSRARSSIAKDAADKFRRGDQAVPLALGDTRKSARRAATSVVDQQAPFVSPAKKNDIRARPRPTMK